MASISLAGDGLVPGLAAATPARLPWRHWIGSALSIALIISLALVVHDQGLHRLRQAMPTAPGFWICLGLYYVALPGSEFVIYRRLWALPASGFVALLRKLVFNELLVGYSGELSFYVFARENGRLTGSPFQAIKDVSILSAMAGNLATLAMVVVALPVWRSWRPDVVPAHAGLSVAVIVAALGVMLALRRRLFSLPGDQLRFIAGVHVARVTATTLLMALMWRAAIPTAPLSIWVGLSALQLVVTRLPFVPNKDIVFAGAAMLAVGAATPVGALMVLIASLLVALHVVVGAGIVALSLSDRKAAA